MNIKYKLTYPVFRSYGVDIKPVQIVREGETSGMKWVELEVFKREWLKTGQYQYFASKKEAVASLHQYAIEKIKDLNSELDDAVTLLNATRPESYKSWE